MAKQLTEDDMINFIESSLGVSWVNVELAKEDIKVIIKHALDKLSPYYEGKRYIQASGKIIDISSHNPVAVSNVYNISDSSLLSMNEFAFGGQGLILFDETFINRFITYQSYKLMLNEIKHQKGVNFKYIEPFLYLDDYQEEVVIEILVRPEVLSDIEPESMYYSWVKEYCLALAKEIVGRVRSKFTVDGSPYTLDGNTLLAEAQVEKQNLEAKLIGEIFVI